MRVLFNGCSWTYGEELIQREQTRYSKLICDHYGWEEYNISRCASSNYEIVHKCYEEVSKNEYDIVLIQLTYPTRLYLPYNGENRSFTGLQPVRKEHNTIMKYLISNTPDSQIFVKNYSSSVLLLNEYLISRKIKTVFFSIEKFNFSFFNKLMVHDICLKDFLSNKDDVYAKRKHPSEYGHKLIANEYLIPVIDKFAL